MERTVWGRRQTSKYEKGGVKLNGRWWIGLEDGECGWGVGESGWGIGFCYKIERSDHANTICVSNTVLTLVVQIYDCWKTYDPRSQNTFNKCEKVWRTNVMHFCPVRIFVEFCFCWCFRMHARATHLLVSQRHIHCEFRCPFWGITHATQNDNVSNWATDVLTLTFITNSEFNSNKLEQHNCISNEPSNFFWERERDCL